MLARHGEMLVRIQSVVHQQQEHQRMAKKRHVHSIKKHGNTKRCRTCGALWMPKPSGGFTKLMPIRIEVQRF